MLGPDGGDDARMFRPAGGKSQVYCLKGLALSLSSEQSRRRSTKRVTAGAPRRLRRWSHTGRDGLAAAAARAPIAALTLGALGLLMGLIWPVMASAGEEEITWPVYNAAPYSITEGADADQGIFDAVRQLLDAKLTAYRHRTIGAPFPRILSAVKDGKPWCFIGGVKTPEREAFATFSLPIAVFYPMAIIIHRPRGDRFSAFGPLSLETLLQDHSLRTSFLRNRALAPGIDALLRTYPPSQFFSDFNEAFKMLLADRLDYLVDFSLIGAYSARQLGQDGALMSLPFKERPDVVYNRVMCPKTAWGRSVIDAIDAILRVERPTPAYRSIVERWSSPEDVAAIRAFYDQRFLSDE